MTTPAFINPLIVTSEPYVFLRFTQQAFDNSPPEESTVSDAVEAVKSIYKNYQGPISHQGTKTLAEARFVNTNTKK